MAETVVKLKNGKVVRGDLIEDTESYVKINIDGVDLTYWKDEIEGFDAGAQMPAASGAAGQDAAAGDIQKALVSFLGALQSNDTKTALGLISKSFLFEGKNNNILNYDGFKEQLENMAQRRTQTKAKIKIGNIVVQSLVMESDDKARVAIQYEQETMQPRFSQRIIQEKKHEAVLSREEGSWKISQWPPLAKKGRKKTAP